MSASLDAVLAAARALPSAGDLRMRQADEVASAYARLLQGSPAEPAELPEEEELPFAKEAIRHAILTLLEALAAPALREALRFAYIRLADWQPAHLPAPAIDLANPRATRDPLAMASRLAAGRGPPGERRRAAALEERGRLVEDLRRRGYG